jgi:hypothetical protein
MKNNLIVPVAADKLEYSNALPYVFNLNEEGIIICIKSIMGLPLSSFDNIYITILKKHDERFYIADSLRMQCKRLGLNNVDIVILDEPTQDQVETVYRTISLRNINGALFIKDADSYFSIKEIERNGVAVFPIEELMFLDPRNKSYVSVDDMFYITNIIEKTVVGHYISAGGYSFESVDLFTEYYNKLRPLGKLYISHMIYAMLLEKKLFRPMCVKSYLDWGTKKLLNYSHELKEDL